MSNALPGRKPRVLLIMHELSRSGAPKVIIDLFEGLAGQVEVRTVSILGGPLAERCRRLGALDILPRMPLGGPTSRRLGHAVVSAFQGGLRVALRPLSSSLARWRPDLIYFNSVWSAPASNILILPDVPSLMHVHELEIGIALAVRQCHDQVLKRPDHYIAVSNAVRRALAEDNHVAQEKITTIYEAIPDAYASAPAVGEMCMTERPSTFLVGGCGTPFWRKGIFLWLQVADAVIRKMGPQSVRFQWIGVSDPEEMILCVESAKKLGVQASVEFLPNTPDARKYFETFDVFAMTSVEDPCPIVVLESMISRTPVVCFAQGGGSQEEIGETGITIEDFSVSAMADAIVALAADPSRRRSLGDQAARRAATEFVVSRQSPRILEVIRRVAGMTS